MTGWDALGLQAIGAVWAGWVVLWLVWWRAVKPAVKQETLLSQVIHLAPVVVATAMLLTPRFQPALLTRDLLPRAAWMVPLGLAITFAGLAFCTWARLTIAGNWSGTVTLKRGHELVRTGPYALVRHPIYTGFIVAMAGTSIALDAGRGWVAIGLVLASLVFKRRTEEAFMRGAFGQDYVDYAARVPALVPFTK